MEDSKKTTSKIQDTRSNAGGNGYWQDVHQKALSEDELKNEFMESEQDRFVAVKSRRSFLQIMGFSVSALPLASCMKIPTKKAIPFLYKNDTIVPGVATWFATTTRECTSGCHLLVKTREGRPIKVEGNEKSSHTRGGTCPQCQASVLSLYDSYRLRSSMVDGAGRDWAGFDSVVATKFAAVKEHNQKIVLVTPSTNSPTDLNLISKFKEHFGNVDHICYDAISYGGLAKSYSKAFGNGALPNFKLGNAKLVLSFGADFLGSWYSPIKFTKDYSKLRDPGLGRNMLKHIQVESVMSLSGSNADKRIVASKARQREMLSQLLSLVESGGAAGGRSTEVRDLYQSLASSRGKSLVVCGDNDFKTQNIVIKINKALGNFGKTIVASKSSHHKWAIDSEFEALVNGPGPAAIIFWGTNPAYSYPKGSKFADFLKNIPVRLALTTAENETSKMCNYVAATNHSLESWGDSITLDGELAFSQPVIQALFGTRMAGETLLALMGSSTKYYDFMKEFWRKNFFSKQSSKLSFVDFWNHSLHDGVVSLAGTVQEVSKFDSSIPTNVKISKRVPASQSLSIECFETNVMGDGSCANNPWLQELPDPITKMTWGNAAHISPSTASSLGIVSGDVVKISGGEKAIELPAIVQPGVEPGTVGISFGHGRSVTGKVGLGLGANAFGFVRYNGECFSHFAEGGISLEKTGRKEKLAQTQTHHSMEGRDIVREQTLSEFQHGTGHKGHDVKLISMWSDREKKGHQWAMAIDLSKCTGCSGCIVSCNAENNVPVVGKEEVINRREMHWMRIDRYYKGDDANPEVVHQPLNCQHCDNAPCETVCPVLATVQSSDGLNQQVYNRCVGTRYCANNCPYKVRRFNWFRYPHEDPVENMVLNPDVAVRERGVMEKCSMCIQRIQEGKIEARKQGRELQDGDIKLACQQSCPADAIVFGDMANPKSKISRYLKDKRNYTVLEELNVKPRVSYLTKIRNKE